MSYWQESLPSKWLPPVVANNVTGCVLSAVVCVKSAVLSAVVCVKSAVLSAVVCVKSDVSRMLCHRPNVF